MNLAPSDRRHLGFTLIELLVALGIFLVITGAAFTLLDSSQKHYQSESQVLTSFQEARLALDQIVRDVNDAGYPPPTFASTDPTQFASTPFAWSPNYPGTPCQIGTGAGGTCGTPGDFDLIIETNPNPKDPSCAPAPNCPVQWIRYQLQVPPAVQVPTLMRGMAAKGAGDPSAAFVGAIARVPFVQNVVNRPAQSIFSYTCDTSTAPESPPLPCPIATAADNSPRNIRDVVVTLIVAAPVPDITTGQPRVVQLIGRWRRV